MHPGLRPFVLPVPAREPEPHGTVDVYLPDGVAIRPAIVFVHGGPEPADRTPTPRDWLVFRGYGALAAARGVVGVVFDHRFHDLASYPHSADDLAAAVELARHHPRVDADRIAIWCFSKGGLLLADWLRDPVVEVPNGRHGFDMLDDTDESRSAIERALSLVVDALTAP